MTRTFEVETAAEFHELLADVVTAAGENSVDVQGGWPVERDRASGWDVVITELDGAD